MARRRMQRRSYRRHNAKIPMLTMLGLGAGVATAITQQTDLPTKLKRLTAYYTGFNAETGGFDMAALKVGLLPLLIGSVCSMVASKYGVNKKLQMLPLVKL